MPKQLTREQLDSGSAVILRKAEPRPAADGPRVSANDLLKEITAAIQGLVELHKSTQAILINQLSQTPPAPTAQVDSQILYTFERLAEIQATTNQILFSLQEKSLAPPPPAADWKEITAEVTERDAYGHTRKLKLIKH